MELKTRHILFIAACLNISCFFSQSVSITPFNSSFWNAYADKIHLNDQDRLEFMSAHKKLNSGITATSNSQIPSSQKIISPTNSVLAGPCINADFELGNLTGWATSSGFHPGFNPLGCCPNPGGQQAIMSGPGLDPAGGFPVVMPGGSFSLRLGNNINGGEADRIEQTFLVSPSNANFSYKYAVVFQDPNHPVNQQPSFQVEMLDTTGAQIPCTFYYVAAGAGNPGFFLSPTQVGVIYKPWSTVMVDLTSYIGQNVTIRFTTYDCSLGGHFGYAYVDGVCQSFTGNGLDTICAGGTKNFCAPTGVASYTWNGPGVTNVLGQCVNASAPGIYTVQTTLFTGCTGPSFTYTLVTQSPPVVNAGPDFSVCANNSTVAISGSVTGSSSTGQWSSSGPGTFGSSTSLNTTYTAVTGGSPGSVNLILSSTSNGVCPATMDTAQVIITPSPSVNAGANQIICSNSSAVLSGSVSGATSTGSWSTTGDGVFNPGPAQLNSTYTPGSNDVLTGTVTLVLSSSGNGNCFTVNDTMKIFIKNLAVVSAGSSQTLCSSTSTVALSGNVSGGVSTGVWSTSGSGGFSPSSSALNASYNITPADITAGLVTFTLTSGNNNPCSAVTNTMALMIAPLATVNAGVNQALCSSAPSVALAGTVNGPGTGIWNSGGGGSYNPGSNNLNTGYNFSSAEIAAGSVIFTLSSTNNGPCPAKNDTVKIVIIKTPTVSAGASQSICSSTGSINLNGSVAGGTGPGGIWTTGGNGIFNPSSNTVTTQYTISQTDITNGFVTFTLTSSNNGPCLATSSSMSLQITPLATVNAGPNTAVCSNSGSVSLNGGVSSPSGTGLWSTGSSGAFNPGSFVLNPSFAFTQSDIIAGAVIFTLTSLNNGICPAVSDSVKISIASLATVNAGPDLSMCSTTGSVNLNGSINGVTSSGFWTSSGSGGYNPSAGSVNTNYFVSTSDMAAGIINFTLTSVNNGVCPAVTDTVKVIIVPLASVNSGQNQYVCSKTSTISLNGTINSNTNGGIWSSSGGGTFSPNNTALNPVYLMSPSDASNGSVTFTLTATGNAPCAVVSDTVKIKIKLLAIVNAGPDQSICSTTSVVALNGTVSAGSSTGLWNTTGSGNFSNNTALNGSYNVSAADVSNSTVLMILTSTNNDICPAVTDTSKVTIIKKPVIILKSDTAICSYQNPLQVSANVTGGSGSYQWSTSGSGSFSFGGTGSSAFYTSSAGDVSAGQVQLTISSINNGPCGNLNSSINVVIHPAPVADFTPSKVVANIPNDPIQFTNQSSGANNYFWNFGDGGYTSLTNPIHNYGTVGYYTVSLIATNQYGCRDTVDKEIKVISDIQFPNVFTPNLSGGNGGSYIPGDLSNDVFFPFTSGVVEYHLMIFNRWGELIFQSNDLNIGWDGYFNGKLCQQDAYVWKADVKFFDGRKYNKTGSVTLLR